MMHTKAAVHAMQRDIDLVGEQIKLQIRDWYKRSGKPSLLIPQHVIANALNTMYNQLDRQMPMYSTTSPSLVQATQCPSNPADNLAGRILAYDLRATVDFLQDAVFREMDALASGGQSYEETIANADRAVYGLKISMNRWAHTLSTYAAAQAKLEAFQESGVDMYRIVAKSDDKVTDACSALDGQAFSVDEARVGYNLPPFHFNCRCQIAASEGYEAEQSIEDLFTREAEIDLIFDFLRYISDWGDEAGGWQTRTATDAELRQISADLVDVMRVIRATADENGFVAISDRDTLYAVIRLAGFTPGSALAQMDTMTTVYRLHHQLGGPGWPYVDVQTVFFLAMEQAIPRSNLQHAVDFATGMIVVGGLFASAAFVSWLAKPTVAGTAGVTTTVAGAYWEKLKQWLGASTSVPQNINFSTTVQQRLEDPSRSVPLHILQDAIRLGQSLPDPRGTAAHAYYILISKNGNFYNLQVIYNWATNTIWHFHYTSEALGPLPAIFR